MKTKVGILMGSDSDWAVVKPCCDALDEFGVLYEVNVMSAHRTPNQVEEYVKNARQNGLHVIIAAAGGAAALPGVCAAFTTLPVIGIPVPTNMMGGLDSLLSIVQMPGDVPVATVGTMTGGARNAGLLAVRILANSDAELATKLIKFKDSLVSKIEKKNEAFKKTIASNS
jgi:5-(carboxyamino)imidazole ribonucleotide mutase